MVLLKVKDLKKYFGEVHAVDDVNLELSQSEIISIVGPNGSGKTTLLNLINGILKPDSGRIYLNDIDITRRKARERARLGIAKSFQIASVFDYLSALDNVRISILSRAGHSKNFFNRIDKYDDIIGESKEILEKFNIPPKKMAYKLSYAQKKLLDVAIAMTLKPKIILLDEPTGGISLEEKDTVIKRVVDIIRENSVSAILVEHDIDIVLNYSDRISVMYEGKIIFEGGKDIMEIKEVRKILLGE